MDKMIFNSRLHWFSLEYYEDIHTKQRRAEIRMVHYPPYTSKYNPIEHRLFCHVTAACKGAVFSSIDMVKALLIRLLHQQD